MEVQVINQQVLINMGQAKKKLDLKIIFGQDEGGQQLLKVQASAQFRPQKIEQMCTKTDIKINEIGEDLIIKIDFVTIEGRQKEAIQYFQNGLDFCNEDYQGQHNLSALQQIFSRPYKSGEMNLSQSKRLDGKKGVTLLYKFYKEKVQEELEALITVLSIANQSKFMPQLKLNIVCKGFVEISKKNRVKLKISHINNHFHSQDFNSETFMMMLLLMQIFGQQEESQMVAKNSLFKLMKQAEHIQGTLKLASFRKFFQLYRLGITENFKTNMDYFYQKQDPQVLKGLFKSQIRFTLVYASKFAITATINYQSQAIMMRVLTGLKKYTDLVNGY